MGTRAHGADFSGADLYYARPGNADLERSSFQGANIARTIFRRANLAGADMTETTGDGNFDRANLAGVRR